MKSKIYEHTQYLISKYDFPFPKEIDNCADSLWDVDSGNTLNACDIFGLPRNASWVDIAYDEDSEYWEGSEEHQKNLLFFIDEIALAGLQEKINEIEVNFE